MITETQIAVPALTAETMPKPSAIEEEMTTLPNTEVKSAEEIQNEQIINFLTEEPLDEDEEVNGVDMDTLGGGNQQEVESKAVELPQPQGIHVLVDDSATFRGGAKPQEEAPHVLSEAPHPVGISIWKGRDMFRNQDKSWPLQLFYVFVINYHSLLLCVR